MRKPKVILKAQRFDDDGFCYETKDRGDEGLCFTMAIGYAVQTAKKNGISLTKVKSLVTDIYKETEDINNED